MHRRAHSHLTAVRRAERRRRAPAKGPGIVGVLVALSAVGLVIVLAAGTIGTAVGFVALGQLSADLPDPTELERLAFAQPTTVTDRSGTVQLARFEQERRNLVEFDEVPLVVLDATTAAEDRTFWENPGFDPGAIAEAVVEGVLTDRQRGASTITQQLVRARLLPPDVSGPGADRYLRKAKELIQAARIGLSYPEAEGKEKVITAYLNEVFYGHGAHGIGAAAEIYFGKSLSDLTLAEAALLAGLPQSPSTLDPYRWAVPDAEGRLVVPDEAPAVIRREYVLRGIQKAARWVDLSDAELAEALAEPVVLAGDPPDRLLAPHFTWRVRRELEAILGSSDEVERGGYRVRTTLDWTSQIIAERWVAAAAIAPQLSWTPRDAYLDALKIQSGDRRWINGLAGKDIHNASMVALDYRTGDILAYVGSAGYDRSDLESSAFEPEYDVAGDGFRQPGSAWKPILYAAAFEHRALTSGSLLLDVTTRFGPSWVPHDADDRERGPVLVREALQWSLNIPAIRALERVGSTAVAETAMDLGITFQGGPITFERAGLAGAIGTVEVRPLDLTAAYGALANGGVRVPPRVILDITAPDGRVVYEAPDPAQVGVQAVSPQTAALVTDILAGNTDPQINSGWGPVLEIRNGEGGGRRPAAAKTGTTDDARDLSTYGYLPAPADPAAPALAVGVWMGNSDHSMPSTPDPAISLEGPAPMWHAAVRDLSRELPVRQFTMPDGLTLATIDAWSGGPPGPWTHETRSEWFLDGTQPGGGDAVDPAGLLYSVSCGTWSVDPVKAELGPSGWRTDVADWLARARRGSGVEGSLGSATAYLVGEGSWGGRLAGPCYRPPPPDRDKDKDKDRDRDDDDGDGDGGGRGGGGRGGGGGGGGGGRP